MPNPAESARIIEQLRRFRVDTSRVGAFSSHLDRLFRRDADGNLLSEPLRFSDGMETRGVMVIDGPGGGKTTLIARALERHPAIGSASPQGPHYLGVSVPSPASLKSLGRAMLAKTGYPLIRSGRGARETFDLVGDRCNDLGISTIWLDEAHDLFCAEKAPILRCLKSLMQGPNACVIILSGTESLLEIVRSDPQLKRRFSTLVLPPVSEIADSEMFKEVIAEYCRVAGLMPPTENDAIPRLFHAGRYRLGRCIETIIGAIEQALEADACRLDLDHFAWFWAMQEGCALGENIFTAPDWRQIDPDRGDDDEIVERPRRQARRR